MKGIPKNKWQYFILCLILFLFLSACSGVTPAGPTISSFTADDTTIDEGDSVNLSWTTTNATTVSLKETSASEEVTDTVSPSGSKAVTPSDTTTYTLTATNDAGSDIGTITVTVNPAAIGGTGYQDVIIVKTITIQPGTEGKDSFISGVDPDQNYGDNPSLNIWCGSSGIFRAYLQFDLIDLPDGAVISSATLQLYRNVSLGEGSSSSVGVYRLNGPWEEDTIT